MRTALGPLDVLRASAVNREWRRAAQEQYIWQAFVSKGYRAEATVKLKSASEGGPPNPICDWAVNIPFPTLRKLRNMLASKAPSPFWVTGIFTCILAGPYYAACSSRLGPGHTGGITPRDQGSDV
eukprot:1134762-Pelagomonas_calceolata.AAC.6